MKKKTDKENIKLTFDNNTANASSQPLAAARCMAVITDCPVATSFEACSNMTIKAWQGFPEAAA